MKFSVVPAFSAMHRTEKTSGSSLPLARRRCSPGSYRLTKMVVFPPILRISPLFADI
jgi:hypothetical protein